jgi:hypothetical protein
MKFNVNDRVRFIKTTSADLDGSTATVLGTYTDDPIAAHYIVLFDRPVRGERACVITEHCLEPEAG